MSGVEWHTGHIIVSNTDQYSINDSHANTVEVDVIAMK